jgi:hypothetical protein
LRFCLPGLEALGRARRALFAHPYRFASNLERITVNKFAKTMGDDAEPESFIDQLMTPGSIPDVIVTITNVSVVGMIGLMATLLCYDFMDFAEWHAGDTRTHLQEPRARDTSMDIHLYVMIFLASGLLISVNWLLMELKKSKLTDHKDEDGEPMKTD